MKRSVLQTTYRLSVSDEQFDTIIEKDKELMCSNEDLGSLLDKETPARNIEYTAWFGCVIIYDIEKSYDTAEVHEKIENIIKEYVS